MGSTRLIAGWSYSRLGGAILHSPGPCRTRGKLSGERRGEVLWR